MRRTLLMIMGLVVAFAVGAFATGPLAGFVQSWSGEQSVRCDGDAYVGQTRDQFLASTNLEDRIGGLSAVFCGAEGSGDFIFLADILNGNGCKKPVYSLEFRNRTTRTLVDVKDGRVVEIKRGPLHVIDL